MLSLSLSFLLSLSSSFLFLSLLISSFFLFFLFLHELISWNSREFYLTEILTQIYVSCLCVSNWLISEKNRYNIIKLIDIVLTNFFWLLLRQAAAVLWSELILVHSIFFVLQTKNFMFFVFVKLAFASALIVFYMKSCSTFSTIFLSFNKMSTFINC